MTENTYYGAAAAGGIILTALSLAVLFMFNINLPFLPGFVLGCVTMNAGTIIGASLALWWDERKETR